MTVAALAAASAFTGRLQLDFGDWTGQNAGRIAITLGDITWRGYTLAAGFMSDGASVPRPLWWFLPPWGDIATVAALFHDHACNMLKAGTPILGCDTRAKCDQLFREALLELRVAPWRAWVCWSGVRAYSIYEGLTTR